MERYASFGHASALGAAVTAAEVTGSPKRQVALGEALRRRAAEVGAAVVANWLPRSSRSELSQDEVAALISRPCSLGTELVGRYFATGELATPAEMRELADVAKPSVAHGFALTDLTKNYLAWRDATLRVLREEGNRLGVAPSILREATRVIRESCDVSVVQVFAEFDVQRRQLQQRLDTESAKLAHLGLHDSLTGLPNRALLLNRLAHEVAMSHGRQRQVAVLFLDLDGFKAVNDNFGHQAGDRVLVDVSHCLTRLVRTSDTVARLGGDEFVILCPDLAGESDALTALSERIQAGVATCCAGEDGHSVTVSIGVAVAGIGADPQQVLDQADAAMYVAKQRDRGERRS